MTRRVLSRKASPQTQVRYVSDDLLEKTYRAISILIKTSPVRPSQDEIAKVVGCARPSLVFAIRKLIDMGVISRMQGKYRSLQVVKPFPKKR